MERKPCRVCHAELLFWMMNSQGPTKSPISDPKLLSLGLDDAWIALCVQRGYKPQRLARIVGEQRGVHQVISAEGLHSARMAGRLRHAPYNTDAPNNPTVGDWVVLQEEKHATRENTWLYTIEAVLPRRTQVARKVSGHGLKEQMVAANLDYVLVVGAFGGADLEVRRLERFCAMVQAGGVKPIIVINKSDLGDPNDVDALRHSLQHQAFAQIPIYVCSAIDVTTLAPLRQYCQGRRTLGLIGCSGAGKSTLINALLGESRMATAAVRNNQKGRHTTRSRALVALEDGGWLMDTPGLREVGMWQAEVGVQEVFTDIIELAAQCQFRNCRHQKEPQCAVQKQIQLGALSLDRLQAFEALQQENMLHQDAVGYRKNRIQRGAPTHEQRKKLHKNKTS